MQETQFNHKNPLLEPFLISYNYGTYALDPPTKSDLFNAINSDNHELNLKLGRSFFSKKEKNFVKATGREVAKKRMQEYLFNLVEVRFENEKIFFTLKTKEKVTVELRCSYKSDKVHFVNIWGL